MYLKSIHLPNNYNRKAKIRKNPTEKEISNNPFNPRIVHVHGYSHDNTVQRNSIYSQDQIKHINIHCEKNKFLWVLKLIIYSVNFFKKNHR
jgi:hypothetical protein